ncbi:MAG: hypothetical protein AB7L13_02020 [Acidimicrobiia bacterium]
MIVVHCLTHVSEVAIDVCDTCAGTYCVHCLVPHRGPQHHPICVTCALVKAGVRPKAIARKPAPRRVVRAHRRALQAALRQVAERHAAKATNAEAAPLTLAEALGGGALPVFDIDFDDLDIDFELADLDIDVHDDRPSGDGGIVFGG